MANEIKVTGRIEIVNGNLQYSSRPYSFTADQDVALGPTPGMITATEEGTEIDLSGLLTPGVCRIQNLDDTNYVQVGLYDGDYFYPLSEILPGESWPYRLCRDLQMRVDVPGTGTDNALSLMIRGVGGDCKTLVEAFNK